jgi:HEAT repeat protein
MNIQALLSELLCGDDERAEKAALRLAQNQQAALPELYKLLESPDPEQRWWAIRTFAECEPTHRATRSLLAALEDNSNDVRQAAALAFCQRPNPQATPALIRALSDSDPMVASLAGNALTLLNADAVPALTAALETEQNPVARREIVRSLAKIGDPGTIPALMKALESDSALLQYWAEHGLEKLGLGMVYIKPS